MHSNANKMKQVLHFKCLYQLGSLLWTEVLKGKFCKEKKTLVISYPDKLLLHSPEFVLNCLDTAFPEYHYLDIHMTLTLTSDLCHTWLDKYSILPKYSSLRPLKMTIMENEYLELSQKVNNASKLCRTLNHSSSYMLLLWIKVLLLLL